MSITTISAYQKKDSPHWWSDIFWLASACLTFYFLWLGSYPLFSPDESRYSEIAREMLTSGDYITPHVNGIPFLDKPILYYWLQVLAMSLFGIKEWALRLAPALSGVIGCLAIYIAGRQLFNRRTGILGSIILATTPLYFGAAHYTNLDLEVSVWISCSLLSFIVGIKKERPTLFLISAYFFASLAVLTKGLIGIVFPIMIIGLWTAILGRWFIIKKFHLLSGICLFLLMVLPWFVLVQYKNPSFLYYFFVNQHFTRFVSSGAFNNEYPFWFYIPIVLIGFFPWTIFILSTVRHHLRLIIQSRHTHEPELFLLLWAITVFIFFSIPQAKIVGYILPFFPPLALLVGRYIDYEWDHISQTKLNVYIISFLLLCLILAAVFPFLKMHLAASMTPYLIIMACILLTSSLFCFFIINKRPLYPLLLLCVFCITSFLLTLTLSAKEFNTSSIKSLVLQIQSLIKPEDEVATYYKYYQELPLYLKRPITIVNDWNSPDIVKVDNWVREFYYGMQIKKNQDTLINEDIFWKRWDSPKRLFLLTSKNRFSQFKTLTKKYYKINEQNNTVLLVNQPLG